MGSCYVSDFRFFTMLHQDTWDLLRWETLGNAVMDHRAWRNWPYEQRLLLKVDDVVPDPVQVDTVEQQFDFRQVTVSSPSVKLERLDMMVSARQWITALRVTNTKKKVARIVVDVEWTGKNKLLRGQFGFERVDDPNAFYLTPTPVKHDRHGIENLSLSGGIRLAIQVKKKGADVVCKVKFAGQDAKLRAVATFRVNAETGAKERVTRVKLNRHDEVEVLLKCTSGSRYLWELK